MYCTHLLGHLNSLSLLYPAVSDGRPSGRLVLRLPTRFSKWGEQEVGDGGRARQGVSSSVFPPTGHEVWLHPSPKDCSLVSGSPFHMSFSDSGSGNCVHPLPHKLCSNDGAPPFLGPGGWTTPCDSAMHCPPSLSIVTLLHSLLFNDFNCVICFLPGLSLLCPENLTQN